MSGAQYVPLEYPKWVRAEGKPDQVARDAAEEAAILEAWAVEDAPASSAKTSVK